MLEKKTKNVSIMYNGVFEHLMWNDLLCNKQFDFQKVYSTSHVILQLVDQIINDTHRENCVLIQFSTRVNWNKILAVFRQISIKSFKISIRCKKSTTLF